MSLEFTCDVSWKPFAESSLAHIVFFIVGATVYIYFYCIRSSSRLNDPLLTQLHILPIYIECFFVFLLYSWVRAAFAFYFIFDPK